MLHDKQPDESSIRNRRNVPDVDPALDKSNAELLHEIDAMLDDPNAEYNLNTDKLKHYLEILQERTPIAEEYVPGEIWAELKEKLSLHDDGKPSRWRKSAGNDASSRQKNCGRIAISVAGAMLVLVMAGTALGYNPIQAFLNWANGVVQVSGNPSGVMELPDVEPSEYRSLEDALEENGGSVVYPKWVPKDFTISSVNVQNVGNMKKYSAVYFSDRGELVIRVLEIASDNWVTIEEKNDGGYIYSHNGVEYYIVSNSGQSKAGWQIGTYSYLINGQINEDEMKTMINSISQGV